MAIVVNPGIIAQESEELKELNAQFRAKIEELSSLEGQLNGSWEGESKNAFHNAFQTDKTAWENFAKVIDLFVQALSSIAEKYKKAESDSLNIVSQKGSV